MSNIIPYSKDQIALLKRTVAAGATDDELSLFVNQCERTGLDPMTRQIYFIKDKKGKVTVCSSIDGLRLIAERSGVYEGQTKAEWCGMDGIWKDVWLTDDLPAAARVGVFKNKFREPVYGVALFKEYAGTYDGKLTYMWDKMPALMIAKVAEALALRKAFPNDLSGIYSEEEGDIIEAKAQPQKLPEKPKEPPPPPQKPKEIAPPQEEKPKEKSVLDNHAPLDRNDQKRIFAALGESGIPLDEFKTILLNMYGFESTKLLTKVQHNEICNLLKHDDPTNIIKKAFEARRKREASATVKK